MWKKETPSIHGCQRHATVAQRLSLLFAAACACARGKPTATSHKRRKGDNDDFVVWVLCLEGGWRAWWRGGGGGCRGDVITRDGEAKRLAAGRRHEGRMGKKEGEKKRG